MLLQLRVVLLDGINAMSFYDTVSQFNSFQ